MAKKNSRRSLASTAHHGEPEQLGELLTVSELARLFAAAAGPKHRCVLVLLFGLGLRAGEVAAIRIHDFDRVHRTLIVRKTKGGHPRIRRSSRSVHRLRRDQDQLQLLPQSPLPSRHYG